MIKKALYLGWGALCLSREMAEKLIADLVQRGEMSREEAKKFVDDAVKKGEEEKQEIRKLVHEEIEDFKKKFSGVSQSELDVLKARIQELENRLK